MLTAEALRTLKAATVETFGQEIEAVYLFGDPVSGKPCCPHSPNWALTWMCQRVGLSKVRVHDLRHTYGSVMLASRVPLEVVSARLRHVNPTITLNIYRHLLECKHTDYLVGITEAAGIELEDEPEGDDEEGRSAA
ncbi:site-specific integrase [uncultured Meiothermus sp.]|uniref:site-specific integrase n=1 Tax=uncultured Meiothermus sp. TaxID=157471 RepID=UPI00261FF083|nr:site-specific integrase [uncultured Meiothermus sp.]